MFSYSIINPPSFNYSKKTIDSIFEKVSNIIQKPQNGILNIVFLDLDGIKNLNKTYRGIDKATDVLSFHYYDDFSILKDGEPAGEVVICEDKLKSQALDYNHSEEKEFYRLLIHSILHILGYDHEYDKDYEIMQSFEDIIWSEVFEK
ncbi:MAG: rRNA maturation RNase YbeY [Candidatus Gracilibacteria bacterium]|nr:rRNA maturation RNase YbeY [Candidatus Gracilibacteria bacterium]